MLCFTGEASASGVMVKEHLSEPSVTRYNLEVALRFTQMWGAQVLPENQDDPAGSKTLFQIHVRLGA